MIPDTNRNIFFILTLQLAKSTNTPRLAGTGPICARFKERSNAIYKVNKEEIYSPDLSTVVIQSILRDIKVLDQYVQDLRIEAKSIVQGQ